MNTADRKKEIVDAALGLISELGIQELTMKRIAAAVGVSEPAIYRHYASKSDILAAVVDEMELSRLKALGEARSAGKGPEETLTAFFMMHAGLFLRRPAMTTVLFSEDLFRNDGELLSRVGAIMTGTQAAIRTELEKGRGRGEFRDDLDPESASLMLVGGFRLLVANWRMEGGAPDLSLRTERYIVGALRLFK